MVLQFETPVRLKTLQFLSHEYKISSRIEIHYLPTEAVSRDQLIKVGHFNFESSYSPAPHKLRELKTVHFDAVTKQVTLTFFEPYQHKDNIF